MVCEDVPDDAEMGGVAHEMWVTLGRVLILLEREQQTPARCREYALAITKLEEAQHWLQAVKG